MKQIPVSKMQRVDIPSQAHMDYIYNVESVDSYNIFVQKDKTYLALYYVVDIFHILPSYK